LTSDALLALAPLPRVHRLTSMEAVAWAWPGAKGFASRTPPVLAICEQHEPHDCLGWFVRSGGPISMARHVPELPSVGLQSYAKSIHVRQSQALLVCHLFVAWWCLYHGVRWFWGRVQETKVVAARRAVPNVEESAQSDKVACSF
jgi:hypothetical protein